jgi:fructokinase
VITTAGEALIDLIVAPDGTVEARLGGGPYNTARAVARLGAPASFLGGLGRDGLGAMLRAGLSGDGVGLAIADLTSAPTTLSVADIGPAGGAHYTFYLDGTSASRVDPASAALPARTAVFYTGALGLVMEPIGSAIESLAGSLPDGVLLALDPNCRPGAITDRQSYLARMARLLRRADLVKTSTDDLGYMYPGASPERSARDLLAAGGPRAVIVTDGAAPVRVFTTDGETAIKVPAVDIVDTVGAGDAFGGAFVTWWTGNGLGREALSSHDQVDAAARAATEAAVITCTRRGADPPYAADLARRPGWEWLPG